MTCPDTHPHRPDLRRRAERLIAALDVTPAPHTLPDIMRAARTLMVIDRLLTQLWKAPPARSGRHTAGTQNMSDHDGLSADVAEPAPAVLVTPPLNRHQRRLQAAQARSIRPDDTQPHHETG